MAGAARGGPHGQQRGAAGAGFVDIGLHQFAEAAAFDRDQALAARPTAGDHQRPVCSADRTHRVVDLGGLLGDGLQRGPPQLRGAVAVGDAEDVEPAECAAQRPASSGMGSAMAVGVQRWQISPVLAEQRQYTLQRQAALGGAEQAPVVGRRRASRW